MYSIQSDGKDMKKVYEQTLGDVLRQTLEEAQLQGRFDELKAIDLWPTIVGEHLASLTSKPTVKDGVMSVGVTAPSLRHELTMSRSSIIRHINILMRKDVIRDIRFTS